MDAKTIREVVSASEGLPLYLELHMDRAASAMSRQSNAEEAVSNLTFTELATRMLRDMPQNERPIAQAACLAGEFDPDLLSAMTDCPDGAVRRWLSRSLVRNSESSEFPYSVHSRFAQAVMTDEQLVATDWTDVDRRRHAEKALSRLGERYREALADLGSANPDVVSAVFRVASRLCRYCDHVPEWVVHVAYHLRVLWRPEALRVSASFEDQGSESARVLGLLAGAMADRCEGRHSEAIVALEQIIQSGISDAMFMSFAQNRLGKTLEEVGRTEEAERLLSGAIENPQGILHQVALKDHARLRLQRGDKGPAEEWINTNMTSSNHLTRRQALDLDGWVGFYWGDMNRANRAFQAIYDDPEQLRLFDVHTPSRHLALSLAWSDRRADALALIPRARDYNEVQGQLVGIAQCEMAHALVSGADGKMDEAHEALAMSRSLLEEAKASNEFWMVSLAELGVEFSSGDRDAIREAADRLTDDLSRAALHPQIIEASTHVANGGLEVESNHWLELWRKRLP
jgi:tetratricopeptide (TPR) repeat protein